jgi:hypothetical protein
LSEDQSMKTSWLAWIKTVMLEIKLKQRRVSSNLVILSNTVLLTTGTTWKKSGIIASTMNLESHLMNTLLFLLKVCQILFSP